MSDCIRRLVAVPTLRHALTRAFIGGSPGDQILRAVEVGRREPPADSRSKALEAAFARMVRPRDATVAAIRRVLAKEDVDGAVGFELRAYGAHGAVTAAEDVDPFVLRSLIAAPAAAPAGPQAPPWVDLTPDDPCPKAVGHYWLERFDGSVSLEYCDEADCSEPLRMDAIRRVAGPIPRPPLRGEKGSG